ncbi:hypothetical protein AMS68_007569 [Peltaster fructicola]|uniref:Uncharacterized protein n=1 Tax=Peltaster fructicola TaxID=286661 RepID=A0A6H0Y4U3_9PEZI|nr:hypothetical protein AMS68_007569 [Peltaster fructicola]
MQHINEQFDGDYITEQHVTNTTAQRTQRLHRLGAPDLHYQSGYLSGYQMQMPAPVRVQAGTAHWPTVMPARPPIGYLDQQMRQHGDNLDWSLPSQHIYQPGPAVGWQMPHQHHSQVQEAQAMQDQSWLTPALHAHEADASRSKRKGRTPESRSKEKHKRQHRHSAYAEPSRAHHERDRRSGGSSSALQRSSLDEHHVSQRSQHSYDISNQTIGASQQSASRPLPMSTPLLVTFGDLGSMLLSGQLEHIYGSWRDLQVALRSIARSHELDPRNFGLANPSMNLNALVAMAWPSYYPEIPVEVFSSACRDAARRKSGSDGTAQHDQMVLDILSNGCRACPARRLWSLCSKGYNCTGMTHFVPHNEIDMVLAGFRSDGPYMWDRHFGLWGTSKDFVPFYTSDLPGRLIDRQDAIDDGIDDGAFGH